VRPLLLAGALACAPVGVLADEPTALVQSIIEAAQADAGLTFQRAMAANPDPVMGGYLTSQLVGMLLRYCTLKDAGGSIVTLRCDVVIDLDPDHKDDPRG